MDTHKTERNLSVKETGRNNTESANEEEYDYHNISYRLQLMASKPDELIAVIFGTISIILNVVILLALYKVQNRITTHYRLIISLAVSDILVGGSVLLYILNKLLNPSFQQELDPYNARLVSNCTFVFIKALNSTGLNISLLNLATMAFDHYIAIIKPLQYPIIMTRRRTICCIVSMWFISILLGFSDFFSPIGEHSTRFPHFNYCEVVLFTLYQDEFTVFVIAAVCLGIMIYIYTRIYLKVLRHRRPGMEESISSRSDMRRNRKALITTLLNIGTFVVAWLPLCIFEITLLIVAKTNPSLMNSFDHASLLVVNSYLYNLLIFNAIADPIIYTVRMREVRIGFARLCSCLPGALYRSDTSVRGTAGDKLLNRAQSTVMSTASESLPLKMRLVEKQHLSDNNTTGDHGHDNDVSTTQMNF